MSDKTAIEWTDATWNPIRGCSRVSQGCVHCYAEGVARRFSGPGQPYEGQIDARTGGWNGKVKFIPDALDQPLRWKRPRRIFVNSMSDLFHESISDLDITRIFDVMEAANWHTFQVLTKRPIRMEAFCQARQQNKIAHAKQFDACPTEAMRNSPAAEMARARASKPSPNIWLGVSVENQATADERIPLLLKTPASVRFLSCEPLLGDINLTDMDWIHACDCGHIKAAHTGAAETGPCWCPTSWENGNALRPTSHCTCSQYRPKLHWVIAGGESGRGARPMHPDWARSLRDQCATAGCAFFFKQWGEYLPGGQDGNPYHEPQELNASTVAVKVGKKAAGRLLDGQEYNAYPETV